MLETLAEIDRHLFFMVNVEWSSPLLDAIMPWLRHKFFWAPLYLFMLSFLLLNFRKNGLLIVIYLLATIVITDQLSSSFIKPIFERLRPCNNPDMIVHINLLVNCGSGFSFPSTHAVNHFAAAQFFGIIFWKFSRLVLPATWLWAALVAFAQVYVGVHYPFDVLGGAVLGILIGSLTAILLNKSIQKEP